MHAAENAEEQDFDQFGVTNSQLLRDIISIKSQMDSSTVPLGRYQGPGVLMPTFRNNCMVLPASSQSSCKPNFDLGFHLDSDSDDDAASSSVEFKVPSVPAVNQKVYKTEREEISSEENFQAA